MIYVMSDIHGHKDKFDCLLGRINLSANDKLIILGDVIDRGPDGIALLDQIRQIPQCLLTLGNHEYMMLDAIEHPSDELALFRWYNNGGRITHQAFLDLSEEDQKTILQYIHSLPVNLSVVVNDQEYILVHGSPMSYFSRNQTKYLDAVQFSVWARLSYDTPVPEGQTIVFGHTPTMEYSDGDLPMKIWHGPGLIDVDCGCAYTEYGGQLGCLCLDNMNEYYSDSEDRV